MEEVSGGSGGRSVRPVAAAAATFAKESATGRAYFAHAVIENGFAVPASGVLHAWRGVSSAFIDDQVSENHCTRIDPAGGQSLHRHHDVESAVGAFHVVVGGHRVIGISPRGGTLDPERFRIVLDTHQRADGEGGWPGWPGGGGRGWCQEGGGHGIQMGRSPGLLAPDMDWPRGDGVRMP